MRFIFAAAMSVACAVPSFAQESYWIANRDSQDLTEVSVCGRVLRSVNLGNRLRHFKQLTISRNKFHQSLTAARDGLHSLTYVVFRFRVVQQTYR